MAIQRVTRPTLQVIAKLCRSPDSEFWAYQLARETGLQPGTVLPILTRLQDEGWLEHHWESINEHEAGRPRRRLYRVTAVGSRAMASLLAEQGHRLRAPSLRARPAGAA